MPASLVSQKLKNKNDQKPSDHGSLVVHKKNIYFVNVGLLLSLNIPHITSTSKIKRLENNMVPRMKQMWITFIAISQSLKNKRSTGLFVISIEILKLCSHSIKPYQCNVNEYLREQTFRDCLKIANVVPLYKNVINKT